MSISIITLSYGGKKEGALNRLISGRTGPLLTAFVWNNPVQILIPQLAAQLSSGAHPRPTESGALRVPPGNATFNKHPSDVDDKLDLI